MDFIFSSLSDCPYYVISDCFNLSFSDYLVQIKFTEESLKEHLYAMDFDAKCSLGAFFKGELISFILVGIREDEAFIIGVGTVPSQRRKGLQKKLLSLAITALKEKGIKEIHLECIEENIKARNLYENLGFIKKDRLLCYSITSLLSDPVIFSVAHGNTDDGFISEKNSSSYPTWQNQFLSWSKTKKVRVKLYKNGSIVYSPNGSVFTVSGTKEEIKILLYYVFSECGKVVLINIREKSELSLIIEEMGVKPFSSQGDYLLSLSY